MESSLLNRITGAYWLRQLEILRFQLGWLGSLGLLALIACLLPGLMLVLPAQQQLQQKTQELAWLNQQPKTKPLPQAPLLNDEQALRKFYRQFPLADELSPQLAELHQLALEQGIVLTAGEYKLSNDANDPNLLRYEIIFPLHSSYKNLKSFIAAAGLKFPTLVLSEINIKRESISDNSAQIKLNFVWLLVRSH